MAELGQGIEYFWAWMAFSSLVGFSWTSQHIKQYKRFPLLLCDIKLSKDKKHQYKKLKTKWLRLFNYGGSAAAIGWCLAQTYDNIQQILMVTFIAEMLSAAVLEVGLKIIAVKYPDAAEVLKEGLYVDEPDENLTVYAKTKIALAHVALGGGKGTRYEKTRIMLPEEKPDDP